MDIRTFHSDAMDLAEKATIARKNGNDAVAARELRLALESELRAAALAVSSNAPEPTRSVLLKSASHLALGCGEWRIAEQRIAEALAGNPPPEIADELRSMFEEVTFDRHLKLRGIQLQNNDLQMVLVGNAIAPGMAAADAFVDRVYAFKRLIYRTAESEGGVEYRGRGEPTATIENALRLFVSVPRAASFAVSLRVASEKDQGEFAFSESTKIIDRVLERLDLFERNDLGALRRTIPEQAYFDNFLELASELAPDGEQVRLVGFTASRDGTEKQLEMRRAITERKAPVPFVPSERPISVHGRVFFFNSKNEENPIIKLVTDDGSEWRLKADTKHLLQQAVRYAAKSTRVAVKGSQVSKTTLQVDDFKPQKRTAANKNGRGRRGR
jgi:hypothetical protein